MQRQHPELWGQDLGQRDESFRWPGGESYRVFRARVLPAVRRIAAAHPGERVLVVTHAGVISQVLGALARLSAAQWEPFRPGSANVTEIVWGPDGARLIRFDDRRHLIE
jgi:alpha-ribazole phosphatase/probable phosphoglycerate mutase